MTYRLVGNAAGAALIVSLLAGCAPTPNRAPDPASQTMPAPAARATWPAWVRAKVGQLEREPRAKPPASIYRAQLDGRTVYYLPPRCCDQFSELYDEAGSLLCHPDGGFTGRGDGRCPAFRRESLQQPPLWRDPR